jgi:hypothetical protein
MAKTLRQFASRFPKERGDQLIEGAEKIMRKVFIAAGQSVIQATPVDTGRARGSWLPGKNQPRQGEGVPTPVGTARINEVINVSKSIEVDDVGVIVNNVPYIGKLNNGSSKQAPAGFVRKAVQAAARAIESGVIFKSSR